MDKEWPRKLTNIEDLERTGEKLLNYILRRKNNWIGHIPRISLGTDVRSERSRKIEEDRSLVT